jgi:hypothetical protein
MRNQHRCLPLLLVAAHLVVGRPALSQAQGTADRGSQGSPKPAAVPANETQKEAPPPVTPSPPDPCAPDALKPVVTDAYRVPKPPKDASKPQEPLERRLQLGEDLEVRVTNLRVLLNQQACAAKDNRQHPVLLYLDEQPMADLPPFPPTDPDSGLLRFRLKRSEASREVWTRLLGQPGWDPRPTKVSIGVADRFAISSEASIQLEVLPHGWLIFWSLLLLVLGGVFWRLARGSELLRDNVAPVGAGQRRPYSLGRTQAAWWFFVVLASYLFIGMVTGDFSTSITGTVLVLLGLSAATTLGSTVIDASKATPEGQAKQAAALTLTTAQLAQVNQGISAANATLRTTPGDVQVAEAKAALVAEKEALTSRTTKLLNRSEDFVTDILSDASGVNFHRFQMATWTLVLSIIFIVQVYREVAMPQFSETLLGLMGISSGTFLGLKQAEPIAPPTS